MKPLLKFTAFILLLGFLPFISCTKQPNAEIGTGLPPKNPSPPPPPPPPAPSSNIIKGKIIEYGTGIPLAGVSVEIIATPGTSHTLYLTSDANGEISFAGDEAVFHGFTKPGYWSSMFYLSAGWTYLLSPLTLFPGILSIFDYDNPNASYPCDSFEVKLFPKKYITIHLKDSLGLSTCSDCNIIFAVNGLFSQLGANYTVYGGHSYIQNGDPIRLHPHIDTTFQYPVFGNANNEFNIGEDDAGNGWGGFLNFLRRDTIFISNNSNSAVSIAF